MQLFFRKASRQSQSVGLGAGEKVEGRLKSHGYLLVWCRDAVDRISGSLRC